MGKSLHSNTVPKKLFLFQEYRNKLDFHRLKETDPIVENQITVCVRKRPLNEKEKKSREVDVVTVPGKDKLVLHEPKNKVGTFGVVAKEAPKRLLTSLQKP